MTGSLAPAPLPSFPHRSSAATAQPIVKHGDIKWSVSPRLPPTPPPYFQSHISTCLVLSEAPSAPRHESVLQAAVLCDPPSGSSHNSPILINSVLFRKVLGAPCTRLGYDEDSQHGVQYSVSPPYFLMRSAHKGGSGGDVKRRALRVCMLRPSGFQRRAPQIFLNKERGTLVT